MADGDLRDKIVRLEADIEGLAQTLDRCRRVMLFAKVAIAAGGIWILAYAIGVIRFDPVAMISAIAAVIGRILVFGSNSSTSMEATEAMKVAEIQRAELIDMLDTRTVGGKLVLCMRHNTGPPIANLSPKADVRPRQPPDKTLEASSPIGQRATGLKSQSSVCAG
jgi:hypothetical protein